MCERCDIVRKLIAHLFEIIIMIYIYIYIYIERNNYDIIILTEKGTSINEKGAGNMI